MRKEPQTPAPAAQAAVRLLKLHTHAGLPREPGETIDVDAPDAAWLVSIGVAELPQIDPPQSRFAPADEA